MVRSNALVSGSALALLLLAHVAGCTSTTPRTEVLVVVDTDLRGPSGIDNLFIEVTSPDGTRQTSVAQLGAGQAPLPRSIGLVWDSGPLAGYLVRVVGNTGGLQRVHRTARFDFQRGRTLVLPMNLLARCERTPCGTTETCGETGCRPIVVSAEELLAYTGVLPGLDGSTPVSDGGIDGGPRDSGGIDAAGPDTGADAATGDAARADAGTDAAVAVDACPSVAELCNGRDDDCDGPIDEDFDLDTDVANCGSCGHACDFANATGACVLGECVITTCAAGFDDCNAMGDDGCEIDLARDPDHCGSCTTVCGPPDRVCCAMTCARDACP